MELKAQLERQIDVVAGPGIHYMELKAQGARAARRSVLLQGIHYMELKEHIRGCMVITIHSKESITWS